jgi:hypothetical protein
MQSASAHDSRSPVTPVQSPRPRLAHLFERERIVGYCAILLAIEVALFAFFIAGTHGWITPLERPLTTDFASFYAAGTLANTGTPQLAYDHAAHLAAEEAATAVGIEYQYFNYPPVFLMLCAGIAHLPYLPAFVLFEAATLLLYLWVARRVIDDRSIGALIVLLAFPMVFWNLGLGQNGLLTAALFGAATLALERRPVLAGVLFGALCYKPHFGLLVPIALAVGGYWRPFAAAALTAAVLVLTSLAWFGADTWRDFLSVATASREMYASGRIRFGGFASPFGAVRLLGGSIDTAYVVQAVGSLIGAVAVVLVWRSSRAFSHATRSATLIAATLVAAPVSLLYDLLSGAIATAWLVRNDNKGGATSSEKAVLAFLFFPLLAGLNIAETTHIPVFPLAALALLALVLHRAWRERVAIGPA